jgi:hypothetical protein
MASVDRNMLNGLAKLTDVHAGGHSQRLLFDGEYVGLYVSRRTRQGFEVREQGGGATSLAFSYRIVARRKGVATRRFRKVARPEAPEMPKRPDVPGESKPRAARSARRRAASRRRPRR